MTSDEGQVGGVAQSLRAAGEPEPRTRALNGCVGFALTECGLLEGHCYFQPLWLVCSTRFNTARITVLFVRAIRGWPRAEVVWLVCEDA